MQQPEIHKELDVKGETCLCTFACWKSALEETERGQVLTIVVDSFPAATSVARSLKAEGHRILRVVPIDETDWQIVVQKQ